MRELLLGCSGWNYPDTADKGGWTGVFYPEKNYYSQFFNTPEMESLALEHAMEYLSTHWLIAFSSVYPS